ncbi:hypothetical protein HC891_15340 [Candidatus Gracilibacteria bacterium]|nr:hypothetical protein [Candidatus Gracilibacteria bacterium]
MNERLKAYLAYFERIATQPINRWEGFDLAADAPTGLHLRDQLALAALALGAIAQRADVDVDQRERCFAALHALIGRMLQRRVWSDYAEAAGKRSISLDPVADGNVGYSGLLAMMLGIYAASSGDARYNEPFVLHWSNDARYSYTHASLVATLWRQMRAHPDAAIADTLPLTSASLMAPVLWATALHDRVYGSEFAGAKLTWLAAVERQLLTRGPRWLTGGIFRATYHLRRRKGNGRGSYLEDARALALYTALAPDLARRGARRFWPMLKHTAASSFVAMRADQTSAAAALPTAWAYLLAVELHEQQHAERLLAYAEAHFGPQEDDGARYFQRGIAVTALIALGEAGGMGQVMRQQAAGSRQQAAVTEQVDGYEILHDPRRARYDCRAERTENGEAERAVKTTSRRPLRFNMLTKA